MRRSELTLRHLANINRITAAGPGIFGEHLLKPDQHLPASACHSTALGIPICHPFISETLLKTSASPWSTELSVCNSGFPSSSSSSSSSSSRWNKQLSKGSNCKRQLMTSAAQRRSSSNRNPVQDLRKELDLALQAACPAAWLDFLKPIRRSQGYDGIWELFEYLLESGRIDVLSRSDAQLLRDEILTAALSIDSRLTSLVDSALRLLTQSGFSWPGLYQKVMHYKLENDKFEDSLRWHLALVPKFPPSMDVFGALLASHVVNPSPQMQSSLRALYIVGGKRKLYDHIIPVLFETGLSNLARIWRKKLLIFGDFPVDRKSKPFLQFLVRYYPSIVLTTHETAVLQGGPETSAQPDPPQASTNNNGSDKGQYSDGIVARLFASSWTSIEFAIHLAQKLGLREIGPRSLQSLALRETDAKSISWRISCIQKLGISISPQTYCKAVVFFANNGDDLLLKELLACDIHPDEFDSVGRRRMLMTASVREGHWRRERLMQGVELAIETDSLTGRLNALLDQALAERRMDLARGVLDRMEAMKVNLSQQHAGLLLEEAFSRLGKHPKRSTRAKEHALADSKSPLNRAIDMIRRVALHEVPIPIRYWKLLLYNLGRLGRLDELGQLCEEIVQMYSPRMGGLMPVHPEDLPPNTFQPGLPPSNAHLPDHPTSTQSEPLDENQETPTPPGGPEVQTAVTWQPSDGMPEDASPDAQRRLEGRIPADLPFRHRQHPVQKIFDRKLQRSIIRWGFDQTLGTRCRSASFLDPSGGISSFDVASGVRLLACLRDQGVLIDCQALRSAALARIALRQMPGHPREKFRDRHELSLQRMKVLVDQAWGSEILPDVISMAHLIGKQQPKLWIRYSKLLGQFYDDESPRKYGKMG